MSDINAALGLSQLKKVNLFLKRRYLVAKKYDISLKNIKHIKLPELQKYSSWHLYVIQIDFKKIGISRDFLIKKLNILNIFPQIHYMPSVEFKKFYNSNKNQIQNAMHYYKSCLSLPIYSGYAKKDQEIVIKNLINILS
jgi:dTDP-4-amino-4,6-dideoxygalactose transaminase